MLRLYQLTNAPRTDDNTSHVSFSNQETSPRENEQPSSDKLYAALQGSLETGLIVVGLLLVALLLPRDTGGDGALRYQDILRIFSKHTLYEPESRYSLIGPAFSIPLLFLGRKLGDPGQWICLYNLTLFSLFLLVSYFLLRNHVDRSLLRKFFLVLIYGSMFVAHLALYYGEVFTALCVGFGVLVAFRRFTSIGGWVAVALGVANTPATLLGLGLLVLKRMFDNKRLRYILVFGVTGMCILTEAWVRRGSIFSNAYANDHGVKTIMPYSGLPGFSYPFLFGLLSILFSFGKGLLFFVPGLLLPIRKTLSNWPRDRKINLYQVYTLWICFLVGLILAYSHWWAWYGGIFWGPRFFLFACIPASFALAVRLMRYKEASLGVNLLTLVVFCLSAWVSVDGAVFQWVVINPTVCSQHNNAMEALCWYTPDYSALWQPFVFHLQIDRGQKIFLVFSLLTAAYLAAPLFIHLLKQIWALVKQDSSKYVNVKLWRI
ncbi:MAG TPA: hypothetical protein VN207_02175 [Ktedonobacteraceae bacterium]|nr:hypothetical protein [Ktedonobacteraceae bacterium]